MKKIKSALISVFHKDGLNEIVARLKEHGVTLYSTGGTLGYLRELGADPTAVESLTSYPSIFGGRVKTLHPKIFGGILHRRDDASDAAQAAEYQIPAIDLVVVDLYPFQKTVESGAAEEEIIEKIDIGGISLIRAAAKNFNDVLIIPSSEYYPDLLSIFNEGGGYTTCEQRRHYAALAFGISSHYDTAIFGYFNQKEEIPAFRSSVLHHEVLRYGENPHQKGIFYGDTSRVFEQLHGKSISYNNLADIEAAVMLIGDFDEPSFAIIKHNNACGFASRNCLKTAWEDALAGDPVSAYGGVIITNREIDTDTATEINKLFFEVLIAPSFAPGAAEILFQKKNRIILRQKMFLFGNAQFRSMLNGVLWQEKDAAVETSADLKQATDRRPDEREEKDLLFACKLVKHTKSNTIVLARDGQLLGSGTGQTSRVDALRQAIAKALEFGKDLKGAVMASDAFFPFPDCVEIAHQAGITAVIQPGGSVRDQDSVDYCNNHGMAMVFTGIRHFKH